MDGKKTRLPAVTVPAWVAQRIADDASNDGVSRTAMIRMILLGHCRIVDNRNQQQKEKA